MNLANFVWREPIWDTHGALWRSRPTAQVCIESWGIHMALWNFAPSITFCGKNLVLLMEISFVFWGCLSWWVDSSIDITQKWYQISTVYLAPMCIMSPLFTSSVWSILHNVFESGVRHWKSKFVFNCLWEIHHWK